MSMSSGELDRWPSASRSDPGAHGRLGTRELPEDLNLQLEVGRSGDVPRNGAAYAKRGSSQPNSDYDFRGRRVVVLGLARQGIALARYLCSQGAEVTISDLADEAQLQTELAEIAGLPVELALGGHPHSLLTDCDLLFLSGGVPPQIPFVSEAVERGIPLSNDSLLTLHVARWRGLGPTIGITGSSGKTTTTTLVGLMLTSDERPAHVGGNIGHPLLNQIEHIQANQAIVLELSSFQLELFDEALTHVEVDGIGPHVGAITNVTPNHLDRHPSMAAYVAAKLNLISTLPTGSHLVVNLDDPVTSRLAAPCAKSDGAESENLQLPRDWAIDDILAEARTQIERRRIAIVPFSLHTPLNEGASLHGDTLMLDGDALCDRSQVRLQGEHNISNVLAAAAIGRLADASLESIRQVATTFPGVPHRLEIVQQRNDVTWINDSIATAPERAVAALRSFDATEKTIILLAGGKDKNLPWDRFADEVLARVSFLIGFGDSGSMIVNHVKERALFSQVKPPSCAVVRRLDEAVGLAAKIATPGAVVLLSPGGTSYDAYKDFEARGEHFRSLVHSLESPEPANDEPGNGGYGGNV